MIKSQKPYVLIPCPFALPNLGGVESHIDKLIKYGVAKGYYMVLVTYQPLTRRVKGPKHQYGDNFEIHRVSWFGYGWFNKLEPYFLLQFLYLFPGLFAASIYYFFKYRKKIGTIHAHGLVAATVAKFLSLFSSAVTVISTHAVYNFDKHPFLAKTVKWILGNCDTVLAVSEVSRQELSELGLPTERIKVHPNWIDTTVFKPESPHTHKVSSDTQTQTNKKLPSNETPVFLFVGRLIELKGVDLLLEAIKQLPEFLFNIVGSGPMEAKVKIIADNATNLTYHGTLMQDTPEDLTKLIQLYRNADYFVSPYLYDEGFSTTLVEALACGTRVIVTDRGSPPTFLSDEVAIFLPKEFNVTTLVNTLKYAAKNKNYDKQRCHTYAAKRFGFKNADIIIDSYAKV